MAFTVPVSKNYVNPVVAVPLDWTEQPLEGPMGIQCSITWNATESGANKSVLVNAQNLSTRPFTKIRTLVIDNSQNGSDVQIIFPDTETTMSVPSYTPYAVVPCFTNGTSFYITSPNALATDKTAFMVLNTLPPPIAVPTTQEQNFNSLLNSGGVGGGSAQMVPTGINGTLEAATLSGGMHGAITGGSSTTYMNFVLTDGTGAQILTGTAAAGNDQVLNFYCFNLTDLRVRFSNGLLLTWTPALHNPADFLFSCNLFYRTP